MVTKTQAIKNLLNLRTRPHLARLYNHSMEVQVNVASDGGEKIDGEYKGRKWLGWTDGLTTWKPFRIPYKAYSNPEYTDMPMKFDLDQHAEAIGMTGWDWEHRVSKWVAFDFDAIIGHSDKHKKTLTNAELKKIEELTKEVDWVTLMRSTSGKGLHIYVFLPDIPTDNHHEHAALARAILGNLSAIVGFDFSAKVDTCGGNMWVWHRKMVGTNGLTMIKQGSIIDEIPQNWRDHVKVIKGSRKKNLPQNIEESQLSSFEQIIGRSFKVTLDEEHKALIEYLRKSNCLWWWDADHHMLVTHTLNLKEAYNDLNMRGYFDTASIGRNRDEQNCFCFPMRGGGWNVRRFTPGVAEHESWEQDGAGWTRCFLNREPDFKSACRTYGGVEDTKGGFVFREAEVAAKAAALLGAKISYDPALGSRETTLKQHKDGRLVAEIKRENTDAPANMQGWLASGNKPWTRIFQVSNANPTETEVMNHDDLVRHLVSEADENAGWVVQTEDIWREEPISHIRLGLTSLGYGTKEINNILGSSVLQCWRIVNKPFQPEYTGDREWNRHAAQFKYLPTHDTDNLRYPTWERVLSHCGSGLDDAIKQNPWAKANGISDGATYLKCWIASVFKEPYEPVPYLFFFSEKQNTGKSIFHEALSLLLTRGYRKADAALTNQTGFNAELEGAIFCVVEEIDMSKSKTAYNRIKDWVTAKELSIHPKGLTPYHIPNTTHWIQCANDSRACPIFPGDTRVTMIYVDHLDPTEMIPKKRLLEMLKSEASDFLAALLRIELPASNDRLNIPVINTIDKSMAEESNKTPLQLFLDQHITYVPGYTIKFSDFYDRFVNWLGPLEAANWTKIRVGREIPTTYPKGRQRKDAQFYIGNAQWFIPDQKECYEERPAYGVKNGYLSIKADFYDDTKE
jgi:hypothetical protein